MAPTKDEIVAVMRRYNVAKHWRASTEAGANRYAVFADGAALTEPAQHREANEQREYLIAADLIDLFAGEVG
jgi:hypothetical protein